MRDGESFAPVINERYNSRGQVCPGIRKLLDCTRCSAQAKGQTTRSHPRLSPTNPSSALTYQPQQCLRLPQHRQRSRRTRGGLPPPQFPGRTVSCPASRLLPGETQISFQLFFFSVNARLSPRHQPAGLAFFLLPVPREGGSERGDGHRSPGALPAAERGSHLAGTRRGRPVRRGRPGVPGRSQPRSSRRAADLLLAAGG